MNCCETVQENAWNVKGIRRLGHGTGRIERLGFIDAFAWFVYDPAASSVDIPFFCHSGTSSKILETTEKPNKNERTTSMVSVEERAKARADYLTCSIPKSLKPPRQSVFMDLVTNRAEEFEARVLAEQNSQLHGFSIGSSGGKRGKRSRTSPPTRGEDA